MTPRFPIFFFPLALLAFFLPASLIGLSDFTLSDLFSYALLLYALLFTVLLYFFFRSAEASFGRTIISVFLFFLSVLPGAIYLTSYEETYAQEDFARLPFQHMRIQSDANHVTFSGEANFDEAFSYAPQKLSFDGSMATLKRDSNIHEPEIARVYTYHRRIYPMLRYHTASIGVFTGYAVYLPG